MTDTLTLSKLIILYMLNKVDFSLTNSQISEFVLDQNYTNYFILQQAFSELEEADFINVHTVRNSSHYVLTDEGRKTLEYFGKNISKDIRNEIDDYMIENHYELKETSNILADYYQEKPDQYIVKLQMKEQDEVLVNIELAVTTKQQAITICDNWEKKNAEFYGEMVKTLFIK